MFATCFFCRCFRFDFTFRGQLGVTAFFWSRFVPRFFTRGFFSGHAKNTDVPQKLGLSKIIRRFVATDGNPSFLCSLRRAEAIEVHYFCPGGDVVVDEFGLRIGGGMWWNGSSCF